MKLDQNQRSEGTPAWAIAAFQQFSAVSLWQYPDRSLLEAALAQRLGLSPEKVLATNGSDEAIDLFFRCHEGSVILPLPTFSVYRHLAERSPLAVILIEGREDFRLDCGAIDHYLAVTPGAALILVRPNNPTGEVLPRQQLMSWLEVLKAQKGVMFLDEAYVDYSGDDFADLLRCEAGAPLLVLRTFSKAYGLAGLRIGWIAGQPRVLDEMRRRTLPYNVNGVGLTLALAALTPEGDRDLNQYACTIRSNREKLLESLQAAGVKVFPGQGNFLFFPMPSERAAGLCRMLAVAGFLARTFSQLPEQEGFRLTIPADCDCLTPFLMSLLAPQLLCLDVDGTLIATKESFDATVRAVFFEFCQQELSQEALEQARLRGGLNDDWELTRVLVAECLGTSQAPDGPTVRSVCEARYWGNETLSGFASREQPLIDEPMLNAWADRFDLALVTGRNRREAAAAVAMLSMEGRCLVVTSEDVKRTKPDPEGILQAMTHFRKGRVWMVGDNVDDVRAAREAGAIAIGVGRGAHREALMAAGAHEVIEQIDELRRILP